MTVTGRVAYVTRSVLAWSVEWTLTSSVCGFRHHSLFSSNQIHNSLLMSQWRFVHCQVCHVCSICLLSSECYHFISSVRVLYTINHSPQYILAKSLTKHQVTVLPIRNCAPHLRYGEVQLMHCLQTICRSRYVAVSHISLCPIPRLSDRNCQP